MAELVRDLVRPETTEALQGAPIQYQCNHLHQKNVDSFRKKVMKGSLHHLPQSVICIPVHFMEAHRDTFKLGNLITLEGPSGNTWKVRATGRPVLHSGWRAFAHDHDLREGDELGFTLIQPLYFVVAVWDRYGVVKQSALTATNTGMYTVASVCHPYEYVHRKRKRRTPTFHENRNVSYGVPASATIASRCKTTVRERSTMLTFSHRSKQWECRKDKDGREVVTILDSDDDEEKHLLDHLDLSFGSAQVQSYRMSKIQRLVAYMKTQGELIPAAMAVGTTQTHKIAHRHVEELKVVAENVVDSEAAAELIRKQAQVSRDEDTMMTEIQDLNLPRLAAQPDHDEQLLITPETILCAEVLKTQVPCDEDTTMMSEKEAQIPRLAAQPDQDEQLLIAPETMLCAEVLKTQVTSCDEDTTMMSEKEAHLVQSDHHVQLQETILVLQSHTEHESVQVDPLTVEKAKFLPPATERGTDCLFETLQKIVDIPMITDTIINIKEEPASRAELKKSQDSSIMEVQSSSASKHCKMAMTKMVKPGNGSKTCTLQNIVDIPVITDTVINTVQIREEPASRAELKESQDSSIMEVQPSSASIATTGSGSKTCTTTCVLKSKRMAVAKLHRAKTLRAAQAMTKKLRSPNFVAVMKSCNVYSGFSMDIPAEFGKRSRLPAAEAKVTLVCDEVPTMCKAVWIGTNPEQPKLDAHAWMEFSRSHFLEEGDVCVFELFNRVTIRIGIHIFRVVGLSRSLLPAHWTQHYNVVHLDAAPHPSCSDHA